MITHVAIWRNTTIYALEKPNRHHHIFPIMDEVDKHHFQLEIQGFLEKRMNLPHQVARSYAEGVIVPIDAPDTDHHFVFLDRRQAYIIATTEGQIARDPNPKNYQGDELFSEDLW